MFIEIASSLCVDNSASDPRAHFGLGPHDKVDLMKIRWPRGRVQEFRDVAADAHYVLEEGGSLQQEKFSRRQPQGNRDTQEGRN